MFFSALHGAKMVDEHKKGTFSKRQRFMDLFAMAAKIKKSDSGGSLAAGGAADEEFEVIEMPQAQEKQQVTDTEIDGQTTASDNDAQQKPPAEKKDSSVRPKEPPARPPPPSSSAATRATAGSKRCQEVLDFLKIFPHGGHSEDHSPPHRG